MMGILPVSNKPNGTSVRRQTLNAALACNKDEVIYLDLKDKLLQPDGSINEKLFTDGTHLSARGIGSGQRAWNRLFRR